MVESILAAIKLLYELVIATKGLVAFIEKNKNEKWFQDSVEVFRKIPLAKTEDEKRKAVSDIARLIGSM